MYVRSGCGMADRCYAADRLSGRAADDGCRCHLHPVGTDTRRDDGEVGPVTTAGHHQHRLAVRQEYEAVRDGRHFAPDRGRGFRLPCAPSRAARGSPV